MKKRRTEKDNAVFVAGTFSYALDRSKGSKNVFM